MRNVFGQPLESCREDRHRRQGGSWNPRTGQCDEIGGGVHQICMRMKGEQGEQFSIRTGQSGWSASREGQNHCVCLGAFALHAAKRKTDTLDIQCDAIPARALTAQYIIPWSTWNGNEESDQLRDGVRQLVETCRTQASTPEQREHLDEAACTLAHDVAHFVQRNRTDQPATLSSNAGQALARDLGCAAPDAVQLSEQDDADDGLSTLRVGELADHYADIFSPSMNRNAGSHLWATHILERRAQLSDEEIRALFTEFCPVSGSPVHPQRPQTRYAYHVVENDDGKRTLQPSEVPTATAVSHCCWPCVCDLAECASVRAMTFELKDGQPATFDMLVMPDPCVGQEDGTPFAEAPAVVCRNDKLQGATRTDDDQMVVIGMMQSSDNDDTLAPSETIADKCAARAANNFNSGMGRIFRSVCGLASASAS